MIEVEQLTKYYGFLPAISDLSFTIGRGEVVGFLGPNGAGKTTTLKILTCYLPPTSGQARVNGLDVSRDSLKVREQVGYLPENVPLYTEMTVEGFLSFAAQAKGILTRQIKTSIDKVLDDCGLEKVRGRIIGHLSKGFKQRVGLAQALLNNPPVLILDEPTIGLDPSQVVEIRQMIRSLGQERTIILSTHILPEVSQICQKVIIINRGRIVAIDTVPNLTAQLQTSRRIHLTIQGPQEEVLKALADRPGVLKVEAQDDGQGRFVAEMDKDQDIRADLARSIIEKGWGLLEMRSQELSLEEVFVQLVTDEPGDIHEGV
jgi:gliding motility-associated transport system ATP-binding protein